MSLFSLAFYAAFGGNLLAMWGILPRLDSAVGKKTSWQPIVVLTGIAPVASLAHHFLFRILLSPFGLESLGPLVFTALLFALYYVLRNILSLVSKKDPSRPSKANYSIPLSLALYALSLAADGIARGPWENMLAGLFIATGLAMATIVLEDIMDRLSLEDLPSSSRGYPSLFMSVGLIALAFSGIDAAFFSKLVL